MSLSTLSLSKAPLEALTELAVIVRTSPEIETLTVSLFPKESPLYSAVVFPVTVKLFPYTEILLFCVIVTLKDNLSSALLKI